MPSHAEQPTFIGMHFFVRGRLAPFDAVWGSRYAEVCDPDGNVLGFHSPSDAARRGPPPQV
jgi:hypothetical protein